MLGMLLSLLAGGSYVGGTVANGVDKAQSRAEALRNGKDYYIDNYGRNYEVNTCRQVVVGGYGPNGDHVIKDIKTGYIYKNYDEERRNKYDSENISKLNEINKVLKQFDIQLISLTYREDDNHVRDYRYIDLSSNKECMVLRLNYSYCLVEINTYKLIRFIHLDTKYMSYEKQLEYISRLNQQTVWHYKLNGKENRLWMGDLK